MLDILVQQKRKSPKKKSAKASQDVTENRVEDGADGAPGAPCETSEALVTIQDAQRQDNTTQVTIQNAQRQDNTTQVSLI
jgi:hypothetical protein